MHGWWAAATLRLGAGRAIPDVCVQQRCVCFPSAGEGRISYPATQQMRCSSWAACTSAGLVARTRPAAVSRRGAFDCKRRAVETDSLAALAGWSGVRGARARLARPLGPTRRAQPDRRSALQWLGPGAARHVDGWRRRNKALGPGAAGPRGPFTRSTGSLDALAAPGDRAHYGRASLWGAALAESVSAGTPPAR